MTRGTTVTTRLALAVAFSLTPVVNGQPMNPLAELPEDEQDRMAVWRSLREAHHTLYQQALDHLQHLPAPAAGFASLHAAALDWEREICEHGVRLAANSTPADSGLDPNITDFMTSVITWHMALHQNTATEQAIKTCIERFRS